MRESHQQSITVIGGGIAGCICAFLAAKNGYHVRLISKGPDPRTNNQGDIYSSTFGGEDSRYVTITEGHPYLGTSSYVNEMYPDMKGAFTKPIQGGGWLSQPINKYHEGEKQWLQDRYEANNDTFAITTLFEKYILENKQSMQLWRDLFKNYPHLKNGISLNNAGILRLYGNIPLLNIAKDFHKKQGVLITTLSEQELANQFPIHAESIECGFVKGGLVVDGLTFRVQRLVKNMLDDLQLSGAQLDFNCEITKIDRDVQGRILNLTTNTGEKIISDHYSLHLGAYDGAGLLGQLDLPNHIAGVAGGWIVLPKPEGHFLPLKVHDGVHTVAGKEMPVVDLNINPAKLDDGREVLLIGGGYLFSGTFPFHLPEASQQLMVSEIHRVTELVLGSFYRNAVQNNEVLSNNKICVRSFTPTDSELSQTFPTASGGLLTFGGGGNTGTTTKAPWVAQELLEKLKQNASQNINRLEVRAA